jgi:NAD(P)-dependent dehydrogenase (short-subunit alcohol dehydrogenase family)
MGRLDGKVAIITGSARGIGAAATKLLAKEGAKVVAGGPHVETVQKVVDEIKKDGYDAIAVKLDVSIEEDWKAAVEKTVEVYGKVGILVNNAGICDENPLNTPEIIDFDEWQKIMDVNAKGPVIGMKYVIPHMKELGGGSIINVSSIASIVGSTGGICYVGSKGALRSISKDVAFHYGEYKIRCNSLHPGATNTDMMAEPMSIPEIGNQILDTIPLHRLCTPLEQANAILFLASDESSYVNGIELIVDGGIVAC